MTPNQILQHYWGYPAFRPLQEDVVGAVLNGQDVLVLMPTGGGKSICFQVPALAMEGICIVVTPLIALMKDQVEQLRRRGIPATAVFSGMHWREIDATLDNCIYGNMKFLYVSPERLQTEILIERVKQMKVCLLAIDEAHCISAWGYDFRPPYLQIADFRQLIPNVPVIALTASATPDVQADIQAKLEMRPSPTGETLVFRQTFARPNLSYSAIAEENKEGRLLRVLSNVPGSAIIYARSRRQTQQIAEWLRWQNIPADYYHAGLTNKQRADKQDAWINNKTRVMVATNAFGMGIDKPDCRVVIHVDPPDTLEAYYQEAGRAGRDGQKAYAVLLYNPNDLTTLIHRTEQQYPSIDLIRRVYQALANFLGVPVGSGQFTSYDFDLQQLVSKFNLPAQETHYALKQLQHEGLIELSEGYYRPSRVMMSVDNRQLYDFQLKNPHFDSFIRLLMRMYGGELFTDFMTISEGALARAFLISEQEVTNVLEQLNQRAILVYEKQKDKPQLTYLTPRINAEQLVIDAAALAGRKHRALSKVKAAIDYIQHPQQCRTRLLQTYFGELPDEACGVCDNCLKLKNKQHSVDTIREQVRAYIVQAATRGVSPRQLADQFAAMDTDLLAQAVRQLLADEQIGYNEGGNLVVLTH
ncbi:RecQ family ATP-dependent DNA helicase [Arsenicibacter rosenii]|uniref:RecQ family ATP-dependent DNA helicase n=1 Tax=Arsenicibacter rosenii TaxID=1750698 RepID=UPI0009F1EE04|nr:ATP-dependent DNA helicase RecQ [Arsenicibacter rosenii]